MTKLSFLTLSQTMLFVALIIATAFGYALVPLDKMFPVHWNLFGEPDSFAPAMLVLSGPVTLSIIIGLILAVAGRYSMSKGEWEGAKSLTIATYSAILTVALVISICFVLIGMGEQLDVLRILVLLVLGLLALIGNYLPKSRPNKIAGLRIRSTLADEQNWRKSHFWMGRTMFVLAVVSFAIVVFNPPFWVMLASVCLTIIGSTIVGTYVSLNLAKSGH